MVNMDKETAQIVEIMRKLQRNSKFKPKTKMFSPGMKDLTLHQLDPLGYVFMHKKAKMSELAKYAEVTMPSMTETVNKLVKAGVVERLKDEKDRRTVWIMIDKKTEKQVCEHLKSHEEEISRIMQALTKKEKQMLIVILNKIFNTVKKEQEDAH